MGYWAVSRAPEVAHDSWIASTGAFTQRCPVQGLEPKKQVVWAGMCVRRGPTHSERGWPVASGEGGFSAEPAWFGPGAMEGFLPVWQAWGGEGS